MRVTLGISYNGSSYQGWQSQSSGQTVQDALEAALQQFATVPIRTLCAGRTDAGVHGLMQVVHFDTEVQRTPASWVRGTNAFLPSDIAVQWAKSPMPDTFHARFSATNKLYTYRILNRPARPALDLGKVWHVKRPLNAVAMHEAAQVLTGYQDFTSFRATRCQAKTPMMISPIGTPRPASRRRKNR